MAFIRGSASEAMKIANYDTNLTDAQWAYLKPTLPIPAKRGRPPIDRRRILDAMVSEDVRLLAQLKPLFQHPSRGNNIT